MYSQDREEQVIADYFGDRIGKFLDVGAHDGRTFSNTLRLAERGWSGVCVEPAASVFASLIATHKERSEIKLVNAALAPKRDLIQFWDSNGDCIGSTDAAHRDLWAAGGVNFTETWLQTLAVDDFLAKFPGPYQFVSLDVEGTTRNLLLAMPIAALGVELLCVEFDDHLEDVKAYCAGIGFEKFEVVGCNLMASR